MKKFLNCKELCVNCFDLFAYYCGHWSVIGN